MISESENADLEVSRLEYKAVVPNPLVMLRNIKRLKNSGLKSKAYYVGSHPESMERV